MVKDNIQLGLWTMDQDPARLLPRWCNIRDSLLIHSDDVLSAKYKLKMDEHKVSRLNEPMPGPKPWRKNTEGGMHQYIYLNL